MKKEPKRAPWLVLLLILPFLAWEWFCNAIDSLSPRVQGFLLGIWATIGTISVLCLMAMYSY